MLFKLEYTVQELRLELGQSNLLRFDYDGTTHITVELRLPTPNEQEVGHRKENPFGIATSSVEPPADVATMFASLADHRLPPGSKMTDRWPEYIAPDGQIKENYVVPLSLLPQAFQAFTEHIRRELSDHLRRTVHLLRWRYAITGPHNPFGYRSFDWSYDGQQWYAMPTTTYAHIEEISVLRVSDIAYAEIEALVKDMPGEPIGHELFREAWHQKHSNPRSALVIGIAAAEVGFKYCVSVLVPQARWLVENVPSPPLGKMLRQYLPILPVRLTIHGDVKAPPSAIVKTIEEGVELRNKIAHAGTVALTYEKLEEILLAIRDLLWILDYYTGHNWALEHVRPEIRQRL